jgi:hypothetical protein
VPRRAPWISVASAVGLSLTGGLAHAEPASPEDPVAETDDGAVFVDRFGSSYVLLEHAGSVGHGGDLSPGATFALTQTVLASVTFDANDAISVGFDLGVVTELTPTDTTYRNEPMLSDLQISASAAIPMPDAVDDVLGLGAALGVILPSSKASIANTLLVALEPALSFSVTAPVADGLTFGYGISAIPRFHRFTTSQTLTGYPCSPAAGCSLGEHTDTGGRNTAFQVHVGADVSLSAFKEFLTISGSMEAWYGWLYDLSGSPNYSEATLENVGNHGGSPVTVSTQFVASIGLQPHPGIHLAVGLWTPGGMNPSGGYYNPFGNRFSTVFLDLTFYPVAGISHDVKKANAKKAAGGS